MTRLCQQTEKQQREIINCLAKMIPDWPLDASPPEIARLVNLMITDKTAIVDPYKEIKEKSNRMILEIFEELKDKVNSSVDPILIATELAIAGNIIDFGVNGNLVIYVVKEKPAINDALIEDALTAGIDKYAKVISNGADSPGTVLHLCSNEFITIFNQVDMVISKGQGNFEALSSGTNKKNIFFLFMTKCQVVAKEISAQIGDIILLSSNNLMEKG
jgi:hypothetical protein